MDDLQKIRDRVRKMLNLANDAGASEGERDNAIGRTVSLNRQVTDSRTKGQLR